MNSEIARKTETRSRGAAHLRAAKDELTRQHILEVAEQVFADSGYSQTKMQQIAKQAGVSLATLYQSHAGKQELYEAVLQQRDDEMMQQVMREPMVRGEQTFAVSTMLRSMHAHLAYMLSHPNYLRMILQQGHVWYDSAAQPTEEKQAKWRQGLQLMSAAFNHCMKAGEIVPAPSEDHARLFMALQQARLASWVMDGMRDPHEQVIAHIQADFVRQFCRPALAAKLLTEDGARLAVAIEH